MESNIADLLPRLREAALACRGKGTDTEMQTLIAEAANRFGYCTSDRHGRPNAYASWNETIDQLDAIDPLWRGYDPYRRD